MKILRKQFNLTGLCLIALDDNPLPQLANRLKTRNSFDLDPVGAGMGKARMAEAILHPAMIGEQHEPFAIAIQATHRIYFRHRNEVFQG
jgi:hypothetical protein